MTRGETGAKCLRSAWALLLLCCVLLLCVCTGETAGNDEAAPLVLTKDRLCRRDLDKSFPTLKLVQVAPSSKPEALISSDLQMQRKKSSYPRVLCFVNTISVHHKSRAQAVADTWGQRCDKLLFFSNASDTIVVGLGTSAELRYEVVQLDVPADHNHLWQKHKATLKYVHEHFRHDYDWFYKADDDAYVIMENLRTYLRRPEIVSRYKREPLQMGHRFNLTQELVSYYIVDDRLENEWRAKWERWVFNSGGPGYVMNRLYLDKLVSILPDWHCFSDRFSVMLPDDASVSFCMMWHDVYPWDTRDHRGRERWHADKPRGVYYTNADNPNYWYVQYHQMIGGVRPGDDCCAPDSVAFHYVAPPLMYHIERTLYLCRTDDDIDDIHAFNRKFQLQISPRVMVWERLVHTKGSPW